MKDKVKSVAEVLAAKKFVRAVPRITERGELLKKFATKAGKNIGYIAFRLTGVPTADLYALDKACEQADNYRALFYWLTNPKNAK